MRVSKHEGQHNLPLHEGYGTELATSRAMTLAPWFPFCPALGKRDMDTVSFARS